MEYLDDIHIFKGNHIIQLSLYNLAKNKVDLVEQNVILLIEDDKIRDKQTVTVEEWKEKLCSKIKILKEKIIEDRKEVLKDKLEKITKNETGIQTALADLMGIRQPSVNAYFQGKSFPEFYNLLILGDVLGCKVQYLLDPDTELPDITLQAIYKDIGLTEASIEKLRDIMYLQNTKGIMRALNILIEYIEVDYVCEYDILSSIATYFGVYPFNEPKHLISENLINKYQEEFNEIGSVEEAQSKFNSFIRDLKYDSVDVKSFERQHILYLCDIQEKLLRMKRELDAIDEPEKFITSNFYTEYLEGLKRMKLAIQEQEERNKKELIEE